MPSNVSITGDNALTLDMIGQYTFCPRRFHLMYVEGRWDDNAYTVEGRHVHRRVDRLDHVLPNVDADGDAAASTRPAASGKSPAGDDAPAISRSVKLARLRFELLPLINAAEDQVLIVDVGKAYSDDPLRLETLGQPYSAPTRAMIV